MNEQLIKRYINFAIENGYKLKYGEKYEIWIYFDKIICDQYIDNELEYTCDLEHILLSKKFIEAITKGLYYNTEYRNTQSEGRVDFYTFVSEQAEYICDGKLEEFIKKILPKE